MADEFTSNTHIRSVEYHEAFKHTPKQLQRMHPYNHMNILEKRVEICISQLNALDTRNYDCGSLIRVLQGRRRKLKEEGNGPKSLGMVIISERLKKLRIDFKKVKTMQLRFRQMKLEAETAKDQMVWRYGESISRRSTSAASQ